MSFITDPSGSIYTTKATGAPAPAGKFYSLDANQVREALLELVSQFINGTELPLSATAGLLVSGTAVVSGTNLEVTGSAHGLVLTSPDGTRWLVNATNSGSLMLTSL
jgi:hypothetical protein